MRRLSWAEGESVRVSVFMHQAYTNRYHNARYILLRLITEKAAWMDHSICCPRKNIKEFSGSGFSLRFRDDRQGDHRLGHQLLASVALREDFRLRHIEGFPLPEDRRPAPEAPPQGAPQEVDLELDGQDQVAFRCEGPRRPAGGVGGDRHQ